MDLLFCTAGASPALDYAKSRLQAAGIRFSPTFSTKASHLLLPVPSLAPTGELKGGGDLREILAQLPTNVTVIGGNLPTLTQPSIDLLQDPLYLAKNAAITAHCALLPAMEKLPCTLEGCPVLVLGWGRIGKCLAKLLQNLGARVTVAARKSADRAILQALGFETVDILHINVSDYRVIYNTVPQMLLPQSAPGLCIDLASKPGIAGENVLWERGLPGKNAPESSGALIAETILRFL